MSTETEEKTKRVPRSYENILTGALSLDLAQQVELVKEVTASINKAVAAKQADAAEASKLVSQLAGPLTR
jgi:hypothetical protein